MIFAHVYKGFWEILPRVLDAEEGSLFMTYEKLEDSYSIAYTDVLC